MSTATLEVVSTGEPPPQVDASAQGVRVGDLKAGAFTRTKKDFKNSTEAINILNFLDFLAQNNNASADDLLLPVEKGEWKLTRAEATKLFFSHLEKATEEAKANIKLPDDDAKKAIAKAMGDRLKQSMDQLKASIDDHLRLADVKALEMVRCLENAKKLQDEIDSASGVDKVTAKLEDNLARLASTNWNFHRFANGAIEFVSRTDVILRYIKEAAGLKYELNCGKFKATFPLSSMQVLVTGHERTTQRPGTMSLNIHPHVKANGTVCFGNGADTYNRLVMQGDFVGVLQLLDKMLPHYNSGSPYINIEAFKANLAERDRLEQEAHVKKEAQAAAIARGETLPPELADQEILDDDPDFTDDVIWEEGGANE